MTRLARALAVVAWAAWLAHPLVAAATTGPHLLAEVCSAGGTRTLPPDHRDAGHAAECPCCTSFGAAAPTTGSPAAALPPDDTPVTRLPATAQRGASLPPLPPSRGPPA